MYVRRKLPFFHISVLPMTMILVVCVHLPWSFSIVTHSFPASSGCTLDTATDVMPSIKSTLKLRLSLIGLLSKVHVTLGLGKALNGTSTTKDCPFLTLFSASSSVSPLSEGGTVIRRRSGNQEAVARGDKSMVSIGYRSIYCTARGRMAVHATLWIKCRAIFLSFDQCNAIVCLLSTVRAPSVVILLHFIAILPTSSVVAS